MTKDIILSINTVEPPLVAAKQRLEHDLGYPLRGIVLIDKGFAASSVIKRASDDDFEEIICDVFNPNELQKAIQQFDDRLLAVTCRLEAAIPALRQVIPFVPYLNVPTETSLLWSTEKALMRDRLSNYDQSLTPRYAYMQVEDLPHLNSMVGDFTFPVIVKPSNLARSLLVTECFTMTELEACLVEVFEVIGDIYVKEGRRRKPLVLVEEMIQGDMYSVDAYVNSQGDVHSLPLVRVFTAHDVGLPGFYGFRIQSPIDLDESEQLAGFETAENAIRALNLRSTTTHIELFKTDNGWKIIEVGARIGGYRAALYKHTYGIDHFYNDLLNRLDMPTEAVGAPLRHAAGLNIYAEEEGRIEAIDGLDDARNLASVIDIEAHAEAGDMAVFADHGGDLIVDAMLVNEDAEQLERDVQELLRLVTIRVTPLVHANNSSQN